MASFFRINLNEAKIKLTELNELLRAKCEDLEFSIDYYHDMKKDLANITVYYEDEKFMNNDDVVILCLNSDNNCISSLTIIVRRRDEGIEIEARTNNNYGGRQFSKLLRAVVIIIGGFIKNPKPTKIISKAVNPVSAYLMINTFNAIPKTKDDIVIESLIKEDNGIVTLDELKTYMDKKTDEDKTPHEGEYKNIIKTIVEINNDNIKMANQVFEKILNSKWFQGVDKNCMSIIGGNKSNKSRKFRYIQRSIRKTGKICRKAQNSQNKKTLVSAT
jgi:hypothetical protein